MSTSPLKDCSLEIFPRILTENIRKIRQEDLKNVAFEAREDFR